MAFILCLLFILLTWRVNARLEHNHHNVPNLSKTFSMSFEVSHWRDSLDVYNEGSDHLLYSLHTYCPDRLHHSPYAIAWSKVFLNTKWSSVERTHTLHYTNGRVIKIYLPLTYSVTENGTAHAGKYFLVGSQGHHEDRNIGYVPIGLGPARIVLRSLNGTKLATASKYGGLWRAEVSDDFGSTFLPVDFSVLIHLYEWNENEHKSDSCTVFMSNVIPIIAVILVFLVGGGFYFWTKCRECNARKENFSPEETIPLVKVTVT
eukprot:TRINITY_DN27399_c0_g1_i1.p1 TRINITY_DN27399_c0_g1~~TRINITY_DN27399_c0_g1_i1.p1  ORF type:complete len:277 (-),score=24.61 TRINITY_DN27399_c0_g1_i1:133-915(-)